MNIEMNPSVKIVAEFMQKELPSHELLGVARAISIFAPAIWSDYPENHIGFHGERIGGLLGMTCTLDATIGEFIKNVKRYMVRQ